MSRNRDASNAAAWMVALTVCFLGACSPDSGKGDVAASSGAMPAAAPAATPTPAEAKSEATNCTRGEPEPILATGAEFKRTGEEGSETFVAANGTDWNIRQFGCDHFAVEFTLTSREKLPSPAALPAWTLQQFESLKVGESSQPIVAAISNGIKDATSSLGEPSQLSETETLTISQVESPGTKLVVLYDVAI